jgi:DNA polymerase II small subunit/DNA polymerase delta subunit B
MDLITMPKYKLRLNSRQLKAQAMARGALASISDVNRRMGGTQNQYPTVRKWLNAPEDVNEVDLSILAGLLVEGLGNDPDQVKDMRFGDVFEFVEEAQ